ncbi:MAG: NADH-quinone oxidoreductase subunit NuoN [Coxiellaceae bacterium]|nr:NADH-quinone oxidoreductase subunit NuoN [Coxiellaceae bacterium]
MTAKLPNFIPLIPEIFVLVMTCVTLLMGLFLGKRFKNISYYLVQFTLIIAAWLTWHVFMKYDFDATVLSFYNMFVLDKLAVVLKSFIYLSAFLTFLYSRQYNNDRNIPSNEFYVLGLLSVMGMMILVSGHNLLTIYLGLELLSLPIYAMVALQRSKPRCIEAAMKYFIVGAIASGMLLYGMSMIFGASQSLDITQIDQFIAGTPVNENIVFIFGLVFLMAGIAFKLGAAPFHMWVPDVYDGAPNSVTLFIASAPKIAAFGLVIRLLTQGMPELHIQWQHVWIVISILSMAIGNLVAIVQTNIKRLLAYSSIAHMGYMILGLVCATPRGNAAALFYIISYTVMTLASFGMILLMSRQGFEANELNDFKGLNSRNPWLAFLMLIVMFSMAGIPPLVGFIAKVGVLEALIKVHLVWLAVVAILFAIIGAYYYIRVVKLMYFEDAAEDAKPVRYPLDMNIAISLNGIAVLLLGIFPGALFALSHLTF